MDNGSTSEILHCVAANVLAHATSSYSEGFRSDVCYASRSVEVDRRKDEAGAHLKLTAQAMTMALDDV